MSDKTPAVYAAINKVQAELAKEGIAKNRTNTQGAGFKFRGIDDVYKALAPLLAANGLCVLPRMVRREWSERASKNGGALYFVTVEAEFDFVATEDGSKHTCRTFGEAMDSSDKATNKAMSAAYKYAALQAFCIPLEGEDNDADAHTPEAVAKTATAKNTPAKQSQSPSTGKPSGKNHHDYIEDMEATCTTAEEVDEFIRLRRDRLNADLDAVGKAKFRSHCEQYKKALPAVPNEVAA